MSVPKLTLAPYPTPKLKVKAILTGGPAAPTAPSLPRAPCKRERKPNYVTRAQASSLSPRGAPTRAQGHPRGQEYLQQCQGVQGDLSHQADLGDPNNGTKGGRVRWRHPLPQPPSTLHPTPPSWSAPYRSSWHTHHLARGSVFTRTAGLSLGTENRVK